MEQRRTKPLAQGRIVRIEPQRGFGFIRPDNGTEDLFSHASAVVGQVFDTLQHGQRVAFEVGTDPCTPGRTRAENVRLIEQ